MELSIQNKSEISFSYSLETPSYAQSSKAVKKQQLAAFDHQILCKKAFCFFFMVLENSHSVLLKNIVHTGPIFQEHGSKSWKAYKSVMMCTCLQLSVEQWNLSRIMLLSLVSLSQMLLVVGLIRSSKVLRCIHDGE